MPSLLFFVVVVIDAVAVGDLCRFCPAVIAAVLFLAKKVFIVVVVVVLLWLYLAHEALAFFVVFHEFVQLLSIKRCCCSFHMKLNYLLSAFVIVSGK